MSQNEVLLGIHAVMSALEHDAGNLREVLIAEGSRNPRVAELEALAKERQVRLHRRTMDQLDKLARGERHQGVIGFYEAPPSLSESDLKGLVEQAGAKAFFLVLDEITDPHNFGACLRSALAAGVDAVIVPKDRAAPTNATVRRSSAGAADRVRVVRVTNLARALDTLRDGGVWLTGLDGDAEASLYAQDLRGPCAIVLGAEGEGMRRLTRERCDFLAQIPMPGPMESLNVSVATGVALFEVVRQRAGSSH